MDEAVGEVDTDPEAWGLREMLWRFLKRHTAGEARKVVTSASNRNGLGGLAKTALAVRTRVGHAGSGSDGILHRHGVEASQNSE